MTGEGSRAGDEDHGGPSIDVSSRLSLTVRELREVAHFFERPQTCTLHQLATATGVTFTQANALATMIFAQAGCDLFLLVLHCEDYEIGRRPLASGFPHVPFWCSECEEQVSSLEQLSFDVELSTSRSLTIK